MKIALVAASDASADAGELLGAVERPWTAWADADVIDPVVLSDGAHGLMTALPGFVEAPERPDIALSHDRTIAVVSAILPEGDDAFATGTTAFVADQLIAAHHFVGDGGRIVVGLGQSRVLDGGRGLLEGLTDHFGSLTAARSAFGPLGVIGPTPLALTGLHGAAAVVPGVDPELAQQRSTEVGAFAADVERALAPRELTSSRPLRWSGAPGSGLGGGAGFALLSLGAGFESGVTFTARLAEMARRVADCDLVVALVDAFDDGALHNSAASLAGTFALDNAIPAVVLTGLDASSRRSRASAGIAGVYATGNPWGPESVGEIAGRVARTWSRPI